jgi:ribosomal protein S8E
MTENGITSILNLPSISNTDKRKQMGRLKKAKSEKYKKFCLSLERPVYDEVKRSARFKRVTVSRFIGESLKMIFGKDLPSPEKKLLNRP